VIIVRNEKLLHPAVYVGQESARNVNWRMAVNLAMAGFRLSKFYL